VDGSIISGSPYKCWNVLIAEAKHPVYGDIETAFILSQTSVEKTSDQALKGS